MSSTDMSDSLSINYLILLAFHNQTGLSLINNMLLSKKEKNLEKCSLESQNREKTFHRTYSWSVKDSFRKTELLLSFRVLSIKSIRLAFLGAPKVLAASFIFFNTFWLAPVACSCLEMRKLILYNQIRILITPQRVVSIL